MNSPASEMVQLATVVDGTLLTALQRSRGYPSVSVLLTTTPGPVLAPGDWARLQSLFGRAQRRLAAELPGDTVDNLMTRLRALAASVRRSPTQRGVAIFVNETRVHAVQLAVTVDDRVVVDPTFATRDLVRSWRATRRYRLLVLSEHSARLYEGRSTRLREVTVGDFPVVAGWSPDRRDRSRRFGRERSDRRDAARRTQMRAIGVALAARHARDPLRLVVAGVPRQLALFRERSTELAVVGEIRGGHERTPAPRLAALCLPVLERHREAACFAALARLDDVTDRARVVEGIGAVWAAAVDGRIALCCVEEGFTLPARVGAGGRELLPAADAEHPDVIDDTVDELIEMISAAGGETVLVEDGTLACRQRIAALLCDSRAFH